MHRKRIIYLSLMTVFMTISAHAQNTMGVGTTTPNPNAVLDLVSPTNNQGLLVPRLTTVQRTDDAFIGNLTAADNGLMVFDSDEGQFYFWFSGSWQAVRNINAGDMATTTYDTDQDGKVDSAQYATIAGAIDGFTVESSVPAGAIFTDNQVAADVPITPIGNLGATDVQAALEEIDASLLSFGTGDMSRITYDTDFNDLVDNAELVNGLSVETAVPVGAVFTDNQTAAAVSVTPASGVTSTDVQAALEELQNEIVTAGGGDMSTAIYDTDTNDLVDRAESADSLSTAFIDGTSLAYNAIGGVIEVRDNGISTAKLADNAVTDAKISTVSVTKLDPTEGSDGQSIIYTGGSWLPGFQDAVNINYDNASSGLTGIFDVQAAVDELANRSSQWTTSGSDIYYDLGNVGFGSTNPLSTIQVSTNSHIMEDAGDLVIGNNVYGDGLGGFFYTLSDNGIVASLSKAGGFEVLTVPSGTAGAPIGAPTSILSVNTSGNGGIPGTWSSDILEVGTSASFGGTNVVIDGTTGNINSAGTYTGTISYDNVSSGLTASTVQGAIDEVAGQTTQWTTTGSDIYFSGGNVGIGTTTPLSPLQVNEFNYFRNDAVVFGEFIANNLYSDGSTVRYVNSGPSGAIFFADGGQIDFLVGSNQPANTDAIATTSVESVLQITADRDVNLFGGIEVGTANTPTPNDGMLSFDAGRLQVYEGGQFVNVTGLDLPFSSSLIEDGTSLLGLVNQGTAGVATFTVDNASGNAALRINSNSTITTGRGVEVNHTGDAVAGQFELSGGLSGATTYAVLGRTDGLGSAGRFEINNGTNNSPAVTGRIDAGTGPAVEGFTLGEGPIARFQNQNAGNGSVGLIVSNDGLNSAASFTANSPTSPAVEITQNGAGPAFSVQSPGGTTTIGDVSTFLAGNVGIGTSTPTSALEVQGNTTISNPTGSAANIVSDAVATPSLIVDHSQPASGNQVVQVQSQGVTVASVDDQGSIRASAEYLYDGTRQRFHTIDPAEFKLGTRADQLATTIFRQRLLFSDNTYSGAVVLQSPDNGVTIENDLQAVIIAPFRLPAGASINDIVITCASTGVSPVTIELKENTETDAVVIGVMNIPAGVGSSTAFPWSTNGDASLPYVVSTQGFSYQLAMFVTTGTTVITGVRIDYTVFQAD